MAAHALCKQGYKVGLLERGKRFNPQKDYIQNYNDWESRPNPLRNSAATRTNNKPTVPHAGFDWWQRKASFILDIPPRTRLRRQHVALPGRGTPLCRTRIQHSANLWLGS